MTNSVPAAALEVRQVSKRFGAVQALDHVDLVVERGEVHALIGANGAGKSTLIKILAGATTADEGQTYVQGQRVEIAGPRHAATLGLSFIHQELRLVPHFTALENMTLGLVPSGRLGRLDWKAIRSRVAEVASELELSFDLGRPVSELNVADRWMLVIGRCLLKDAQIVAMDEPTAALSQRETDILFRSIRRLATRGAAVLYVSHRLEEVEQICSRATVFREGHNVSILEGRDLVRPKMFSAIVGAEFQGTSEATQVVAPPSANEARVIVETRGLTRGSSVREASLTLRKGEILGLAGLVGSGRTELARLIVGADSRDAGQILVDGAAVAMSSPVEAMALGIVLVPEDRRSQGLVMNKSVSFNLNLTRLRQQTISRWLPLTSVRQARARALELIGSLGITPPSPDRPVRELSGGNQQKVALGRGLGVNVRALILDEPTQGVDIGARGDIHRLIRDLAAGGLGVIVIASEFEELLGCSRVLVMSRGRIVAELTGSDVTERRMLAAAYSASEDPDRVAAA